MRPSNPLDVGAGVKLCVCFCCCVDSRYGFMTVGVAVLLIVEAGNVG